MNLTNDDVQEILRLLDASPYCELRLETERFKLILRRAGGNAGGWTQERQTLQNPHIGAGKNIPKSRSVTPGKPLTPTLSPLTRGEGVEPQPAATPAGLIEIRPPIIGTFYRAPKPGAPPFVEVGSHVREDSVVAIVETMKLMNSVYAGVRGRVVEICVADAEFVEQGRVLMRVQPERA